MKIICDCDNVVFDSRALTQAIAKSLDKELDERRGVEIAPGYTLTVDSEAQVSIIHAHADGDDMHQVTSPIELGVLLKVECTCGRVLFLVENIVTRH